MYRLYRRQWLARGYADPRASEVAAPPPAKGFHRVYHLCKAQHAIENIESSRLKVATFKDCNDPFELSIFYSKRPDQQQRLKAFIDNHVSDRVGVVCFSEDWSDPVLWSHYADKHQGVALGFDVFKGDLLRVKYQMRRAKFPTNPTKRHVDKILGTKFKSWEYERERRIMVELASAEIDGGLKFERFGAHVVLREVILGPLCAEDVATIRTKVDGIHSGVTTFKAELAERSFKVIASRSSIIKRSP